MSKSSTKWSPGEIEQLRALAAQGMRPSVIADRLGRTTSGIRGKAISCGIEMVGERSVEGVSLRARGLSFLTAAMNGELGQASDREYLQNS